MNNVDCIGCGNETAPYNFSNISYLPEGFNPSTDTLTVAESGKLIWTHYYTVDEILNKLVPLFLIFLFLTVYISHIYIAPKLIKWYKSKYGRNINETDM